MRPGVLSMIFVAREYENDTILENWHNAIYAFNVG